MKSYRKIPIFYACDNKFARYTLISIRSMMENASPDYRYRVYILCNGVDKEYQDEARRMSKLMPNFKIRFVDVTVPMEKFAKKLPVRDYYSLTTYYRLLIPSMFPRYQKAVYVDSDTIVLGDISELYLTRLGKKYAGVCPDRVVAQVDTLGDYTEKVLGVNRKKYFNAGVMLINCFQFREKKLLDKFVELLHVYTFTVAQDQDYLNLICKDKVRYLDPKWNAQVFGELACKESEVSILHYNMASKPWNYPDCRFAVHFWKYAKMTPYYDSVSSDMVDYTDAQRRRDALSGDHLMEMAISEINNEENYLRLMNRAPLKSADRLAILEKIKQYEKEGRFSEDVEDDPPAPELKPEDIEYLPRSIKSMLQTKYAFKMARWFVTVLISKKQLIIKEYKGIENFKNLKSGAVVTCNHFNAFDSFAIHLAYEKAKQKKRRLYRVIREGNYTGFPGFYGFLMRNCYTLPLSSNFKTMEKFIKAVDKVLQRGHFLLVYPEQSMWWNYRKPKPLQKGAYTFAVRNNVPVLPCFITMEDSSIVDGDGFYVQEYTVHVGKPIYPDPFKTKAQNVQYMKEENYRIWKEIYEDTYGIPLSYEN